jgi:acyl-CoA synthetase (AMP-forming)/AMP-acid ligase II
MTNRVLTRLDREEMQSFYSAGYWQDTTIYRQVLSHAVSSPDKVAIQERDRSVTYSGIAHAADRFAATLKAHGVIHGDRVAVWLPSRIEVAVVVLACSRNGYICCPSLHRDHTVGEVVDLVTRMNAVALVAQVGYGADAERRDVFIEAGRVESLRLVAQLDELESGVGSDGLFDQYREFTDAGTEHVDPNTIVYLAFTSGSTGQPKGVMHSDNTVLAPVRSLARDWSLGADMVIYSLSPLSHNLGFGAMLLAISGGGTLVVHDLPRGASVVDRLQETGVTFVFGVPTHAIDLLAELENRSDSPLSLVKGFRVSGAAISSSVAQGLLDHGVVPQSGYGMTEAGSHHYTRQDDPAELIIGSSGRPCAGHETMIVSQEDPDVELPSGIVGQIASRGATIMLGYFDDQISTEKSFNATGWFLTGDLGWMDDAGYVRVTGRKKDVIIRGGRNIFPAKIENLAMQHGAVLKAAVIPVPDERLGEKVCLVVSLKPRGDLTGDGLLAHLDAADLSKFDMPEYFIRIQDIPLLPSGKVDKRRLIQWLQDGKILPTQIRFTSR